MAKKILAYLKSLFSPSAYSTKSVELIDRLRLFNALFLIRIAGLIVNVLTLPLRNNLPAALYQAFHLAFYPLFAYNLLLFFFQKRVYQLLAGRRWWVIPDILVSAAVIYIGAGWRSTYFLYTISTVGLATLFAQWPGTAFSCFILGTASFFKNPDFYGDSILLFNTTALDVRIGTSVFYVTTGVILGYFNHLLHRIQKLSLDKIEAVRKKTAAEQKIRLAADLHDNVKSKITAILLLYRPLLKNLFAVKTAPREELLKIWKWLNYLQEATLRLFASLKNVSERDPKTHRADLIAVIREELRLMSEITDFQWEFNPEIHALKVPKECVPAVQRFLGEATLTMPGSIPESRRAPFLFISGTEKSISWYGTKEKASAPETGNTVPVTGWPA